MFAPERRKKIKEIFQDQRQIEVSNLSGMLGVSEVTVRRDLESLEKEGFLTRIYGGAYINDDVSGTQPAQIDKIVECPELDELGKIAAHFVDDNSAIIIGPGKVNVHIAKQIKEKSNVKVMTTDLNIVEELCQGLHSITPVIIGGDVDIYTRQVTGAIASMVLSNINVNLSFVEIDGITMDKGYYVDSYEKASITQSIMSISKTTIAICNTPAYNNSSFFYLDNLNAFDYVIATPDIPDDFKKYYFDKGIKLYTSYDIYQQPGSASTVHNL